MKKTLSILAFLIIAIDCYAQVASTSTPEETGPIAVFLSAIGTILILASGIVDIAKKWSTFRQTLFLILIQAFGVAILQSHIPWGFLIFGLSCLHTIVFVIYRIRESIKPPTAEEENDDDLEESYDYPLMLKIAQEVLDENQVVWETKEELKDFLRYHYDQTIKFRYMEAQDVPQVYIIHYVEGLIVKLADSIHMLKQQPTT